MKAVQRDRLWNGDAVADRKWRSAQCVPRREGERPVDSFAPAHSGSRPALRAVCLARLPAARLFDRKPAADKQAWSKLWIYDLRTNQHFTLKENPLKRANLDEFVACYSAKDRTKRKESERWKSFTYEELLKRDKVNLDITWLKDEALEDSANLPDPDVLALEIVEDLEAALAQFAEIAADLKR